MPTVSNAFSQTLANECRELAEKWLKGEAADSFSASDIEGWHSRQCGAWSGHDVSFFICAGYETPHLLLFSPPFPLPFLLWATG
mgnify:CR=1 FL=1